LDYIYHIQTRVEKAGGLIRSLAEGADEVFRARVAVEVRPGGLEIERADVEIISGGPDPADLAEPLARLKGVRVGSGMTKIVTGLFQDSACPRLAELYLEAMEAVILALTRPLLADFHGRLGRPAQGEDAWLNPAVLDKAGRAELLVQSPRLAGSCAAFPKEED